MSIDPNLAAGTIAGLLGATVLLAILYGPWQRLCTDYARNAIFEQRDALFDLALSGRLAFGSEPYEAIRSSLNGLIRMAHRLSAFELGLSMVAGRLTGDRLSDAGLHAKVALIGDPGTRDDVTRVIAKAKHAALAMVLARSPGFVMFVLLPSAVVMLMRQGLRRTLDSGRRTLTGQIEHAMAVGSRSLGG
jgi:hypothetical protein